MESIADATEALFGNQMISFADARKIENSVNSSEYNKIKFAEEVDKNKSNQLAAGIGMLFLGRYAEAVELLKKSSDCKEKFFFLGCALRGAEKYDEALEAFDKALKQKADNLLVVLEKIDTLRLAKKFEEAEKQAETCANFAKVSADYHYQLGRLLSDQGKYEEAISNFEIAAELDPNHHRALFHLAFACDLRGDDEAAIDYYKQIKASSPVYVNALLNLAVLHEDRGEYEKAESCVEMVLNCHPNHKRAQLFLKDILSSQDMVYDEEKEKLKSRRNKILEIPISDFELSVRSRNCLKKMNIHTIGDLLRITEAELLSYKNFGETSLTEIKRILEQKGLRLGMALEDKKPPAVEPEAVDGADAEMLGKTVDDLELSVRARRCLQRLNIRTLAELCARTEAELLGCKNFGVTSLNEIKERLSEFGLGLRKLD
ncbi:DNA-directed RNA polymerase subunit alpha C-terminal domain-containing protein [Anaerohalosphaera lusitana]|nr:DNA-directed RNA polymerase subunit alpha C-terminal domain-containing protein [Anaerohalosphaera lusitana]